MYFGQVRFGRRIFKRGRIARASQPVLQVDGFEQRLHDRFERFGGDAQQRIPLLRQ